MFGSPSCICIKNTAKPKIKMVRSAETTFPAIKKPLRYFGIVLKRMPNTKGIEAKTIMLANFKIGMKNGEVGSIYVEK